MPANWTMYGDFLVPGSRLFNTQAEAMDYYFVKTAQTAPYNAACKNYFGSYQFWNPYRSARRVNGELRLKKFLENPLLLELLGTITKICRRCRRFPLTCTALCDIREELLELKRESTNMPLFKNSKPLEPAHVRQWFESRGLPLPDSFVMEFAPLHGASKTSQNVYTGAPHDEVSVECFFDLALDVDVAEIAEYWRDFELPHLVPFARSAGGNYVCVSRDDGSIWFTDHELCGYPDAAQKLESNLAEFLKKLVPYALD